MADVNPHRAAFYGVHIAQYCLVLARGCYIRCLHSLTGAELTPGVTRTVSVSYLTCHLSGRVEA